MENEKFNEQYEFIQNCEKNGEIATLGYDGLQTYDLIEFVSSNTAEQILEKLYRTKKNVIARGHNDKRWVNDYALVQLFIYVCEQNAKMKNELSYYVDMISDYEEKIVDLANDMKNDIAVQHKTAKQFHTRMGEKFETGQGIGI